jgi:RimJ/RimL family protein N-acetyltransferase
MKDTALVGRAGFGQPSALAFTRPALLRYEDELLFVADPALHGEPFRDVSREVLRADLATLDRLPETIRERLADGPEASTRTPGDALYVILERDGTLLHQSFLRFATRSKRLLAEELATPLIGPCVTVRRARGQGLYPRMLRHIMSELATAGHRRVVIYCDEHNRASVRGIERAGFRRVCRMRSLILLDRFCLQLRLPPLQLRAFSF